MRPLTSPARPGTRGHTLVEMMFSTGILVFVVGAVFSVIKDSSDAFHECVRSGQARQHCSMALDRLVVAIEEANPSTLAIDATHAEGDRITIQMPLAVTAGTITWGAESQSNGVTVEHPNALETWLLIPDPVRSQLWRLVRRVTDSLGVPLVPDEVVVDQVDRPNALQGKGLSVVRTNRMVALSVRLRLSHEDSAAPSTDDLVKSQNITIRLRNP